LTITRPYELRCQPADRQHRSIDLVRNGPRSINGRKRHRSISRDRNFAGRREFKAF
jgi:hypothetical protein